MIKKGKKLLAGLLASLMVIVGLPMGASAAAADVHVDINLSVGTLTDGWYGQTGMGLMMKVMGEGITQTTTTDEMVAKGYADKLNGLLKAGDTITIEKGQTLDLGIDLSVSGDDQAGIVPTSSVALEVVGTDNTNKDAFTISNSMLNPILQMAVANLAAYNPGTTAWTLVDPGTKLFDTGTADTDGKQRMLITFATSNGFMPSGATWDAAIQLTANKAGTYEISVPSDDSNTNSNGVKYSALAIRCGGLGNNFVANTTATSKLTVDQFSGNKVTVVVTSSDPTAKLEPTSVVKAAKAQDVKVTLSNATFKDGLAASDFTIDGSNAPTISKVTVDATKKIATLTLDASGSTVDATHTVSVNAGAAKANDGTATTDALTAGTLTIAGPLAGTVTVTGTTTYGDKLTAAFTPASGTAPTDLVYTWYKNSVSAGNKVGTGEELPLGKITGLAYGTDTLVCVASSASLADTSVTSSATAKTAKKPLTAPSTITGIKSVQKDADGNAKKVTGTVTLVGAVSGDTVTANYTATYGDTSTAGSVSDVTVVIDAITNDYYTYNGETKNNQNGTVTLAAAYQLKTTSVNDAGATLTFDNSTYLGGSAADIKVTNLADYEQIDTVSTTTSGVTVTKKDGETFTISATAPASDTDVKITITLGKKTKTISKSSITAAATKPYDGDNTATATFTINNDDLYTGKTNVTVTANVVYAGEDAGTTTLTVSNMKLSGADAAYYTLDSDVNGDYTVVGIKQAEISSISASAEIGRNPELDDVVDAILAGTITVNGFNGGTLAKNGVSRDTVIAALKEIEGVYDAGDGEGTPAVTPTEKTVNGAITISEGVEGDTYVLPDGATVSDLPTGITYDTTTHTLTVGSGDIEAATITVTVPAGEGETDPTTFDITVSAFTPAEATPGTSGEETWDFSGLAGQTIDVEITLGALADSTPIGKNFETSASTAVTVAAAFARNASTPGGVLVTFDSKGLATVSEETVEVDADGKITALPEVSDVAKGVMFKGWSIDGTAAHIVNIGTYSTDKDVTLYAVYDGYMSGYEDKTARPDRKVTRAELITMLVIASGEYDASVDYGKPTFSDAQSGWYVPFIACAQKAGIVSGDADTGRVRPNDPITREEAAILISKTFGVEVVEGGTTDKITDFDAVDSWAKDRVAALVNNGTINGYEDGTFRARRNITRAESAQMINKYLGLTQADKDAIAADTTIVSPFSDVKTKDWKYGNIMFASLSVPASYYQFEITMPTAE